MAKKTRHDHKVELRRNDLLEYGFELKEFAARNLLTLVLAAGVVVCGFVLITMMTAKSRATAAQVWETYLAARGSKTSLQLAEEFQKKYPSEPLALVALGDAKLADLIARRGEVSQTDLKAGLDSATGLFQQAERQAGDRFAKAQAQLGLGAVEEFRAALAGDPAAWGEKLKAAQAQYDAVIKADAEDAPALEAKRRLERMAEYPSPSKVSDPGLKVGSGLKAAPRSSPESIPGFEHPDLPVLPESPAPKNETPKAETPKAETPKAETPKAETPKAETPKADTPKAEPKTPAGKADAPAPKAETPKAESPKAEAKK